MTCHCGGSILAIRSGQTLAAERHPGCTQSEMGGAENTAAGTAGNVQQLADSADHLIQVTPVSVTLAANAAVDAANLKQLRRN